MYYIVYTHRRFFIMASAWFSNADDKAEFVKLTEGDYTIQLGAPREERRGNYDAIIFPFQTNGNPNIVPHEISLLYPTDQSDTNGIARSKRILGDFYKCFGVDPRTSSAEPSDFYHRLGRVHIGRNQSGYLSVDKFYHASDLTTIIHDAQQQSNSVHSMVQSALI